MKLSSVLACIPRFDGGCSEKICSRRQEIVQVNCKIMPFELWSRYELKFPQKLVKGNLRTQVGVRS
jgi:hypothetical protein